MSDWRESLRNGEADARAVLGKRERKARDVPLYGFAWAVLDYTEIVRESVKRNDTEGALNAFLQAVSYHTQMKVMHGAESYNGWPVGLDQVIRAANRGVKGQRSDFKAETRGAPKFQRQKGSATKDMIRVELQKKGWAASRRGIAGQLARKLGLNTETVRRHLRAICKL